jgi:hypothetical protein
MGSILEDVNGSRRQFLTYEQGHGITTRRASQGHQCLTEKSVLYVFGTCYLQLTDVQMRGEEIPLTATECQNKMHPATNTNVINTSNTNQSQHHGKTENQWVHLGVQALLGPKIRLRYTNWTVLCVLGAGSSFLTRERICSLSQATVFVGCMHLRICFVLSPYTYCSIHTNISIYMAYVR